MLSYVRHSKSNGSLFIFMGATVDTESTIILRASSQLQNIIFFFSIVTTTSWFAQMSWSRCSSLHSDSCVAIEHGLSFMLLLLLLKVPPASALLYSRPLFLIFINIQQASMSVGAIFLHRGIQLYPFALYMLHQMPLCQAASLLPSVAKQQECWWEGSTFTALPPSSSSDAMD